jgi:tetratricopeptide (TPR) repeat protein
MAANLKDPVQFWEELKQRKVVRAMTVYIAGAFALLQAVDMIFPRVGLPSWSETLVMILLAAGFIVVIILTWIYDITPEGIKRTNDREQADDESKPELEYVVTGWKSSMSQSHEELISYNNKLFEEKVNQDKRKNRFYSYSSVVVILAVVVLFTFSSANTVPFERRDWIVITDFENLTENPVFDKSLYTAFTLTASQSRYINILPRSRMLETMTRMKINGREYVDDKTGREIAVREGIDVYIVPSISEIGSKYVIAAKIIESKSGNLLRSEVIYANNQDEILEKLDMLSKRLRRNLGESRYNIAGQDKPLKKVTTSSLEALKIYSQGIDCHLKMDFEGARKYYEDALKIDTGFTSARASLGNLLIEKFDPVKGRELLSQAVKSVDKLTERERLSILTFYAVNEENNIPKGIEYARMRIELYPDDASARTNLGWYYLSSGQFEEALKEYKATVRIFPDMVYPYGGIEWIYLEKLGNVDSALVWAEKLISDNPENAWGYFYLGSSYLGLDSLSKAEKALRKAYEINPDFLMNTYRLAHTYRVQGRYNEAIDILKKILDTHQDETSADYDLGINYELMGNKKEAGKYYLIYKKVATEEWTKTFPDDPETYFGISAINARFGDFESSLKALQKATDLDSAMHEKFAEILCLQGKIPEALNETEKALKKGYRDIVWLKINPDYQAMQNEILFRALLKHYFNH